MSTMLDAQMLDYSVQDVPMQSSTSSWFAPEDIMEEDRHFSPEKNNFSLDTDFSVEVEMEPYADHSNEPAEYEMSDDDLQIVENNELLDVEVTDASHIHTPLVHDITLSTDAEPTYAPVTVEHDMSFVEQVVEDDTRQPEPFPVVEDAARQPESFVEEVTHTSSHPLYPAVEDIVAPQEDHTPHEDLPSFVQASEEVDYDPNAPGADVQPSEGEPDHDSSPAEASENSQETENPPVQADGVPLTEETEKPREEATESETKDPHEISEGVYIDPPPAVLLSVSSLEDVCLFNLPARSGTTTPSGRRTESPEPALVVLLGHLPTLYYEPLSKVFDALRQEEYISRISGLAHSELILDAYDLQLVIPEDNIYSREISLHDLNLLHDGLDLPGSLRLRLQTVAPRFIIRYHMLQDQISRLNVEAHHEDTTAAAQDQDEEQEYEESREAPTTNNDDAPDNSEYPELPEEEEEEAYADQGTDGARTEVAYADGSAEEEQVHDLEQQGEPTSEQAEEAVDDDAEGGKQDLVHTGLSTPRVPDSALPPDDSKTTGNEGEDTEEQILQAEDEEETTLDTRLASTSKTLTTETHSEEAPVASTDVVHSYDEEWDDNLDAEGDPDLAWEEVEDDQEDTASNESIATLSSHTSKRSYHDLEPNEEEPSQGDSPGTKRARIG